jgi:hypothetical protein
VTTDPSLLRFLQERLSLDVDLILFDTPMFGLEVNNPEFERRFLDRAPLLHRVRTDLALLARCVEAMQEADRYADHPDYRVDWRHGFELPAL